MKALYIVAATVFLDVGILLFKFWLTIKMVFRNIYLLTASAPLGMFFLFTHILDFASMNCAFDYRKRDTLRYNARLNRITE